MSLSMMATRIFLNNNIEFTQIKIQIVSFLNGANTHFQFDFLKVRMLLSC